MAKNAPTFDIGPFKLSATQLKDFVAVTEVNRPNAAILGRIMYVITGSTYRGHFALQPAFKKGQNWLQWKPWQKGFPMQYSVFFQEDMNEAEEIAIHRKLVSKFIEEGSLFIKPSDPILKYSHINKL